MWLLNEAVPCTFALHTPSMRKIVSFLLAFFLSGGLLLQAQVPDSVKIFVDSALNVMQRHSVFSNKVNWKQVRDSVQLMTAQTRTYKDAHPALQYAFNKLGDKHGWLVLDGQDYKNPHFVFDTTRLTPNIKLAASKGPRIYTANIQQQFVYISIPFFGGQTVPEVKKFAQRIQDSLCKNISPATKGIIIDLRLNAGGNMFPMIAGVANVLGDGLFSTGMDGSGKTMGQSTIENGALSWYDSIPLKTAHSCGDLTKLPVALIIGPVTGSAGEMMAIAFTGRPTIKLIGENTGGFVTANDGRYLPGKDNGIVIAMEYTRDRNGKAYYDDVVPDIKVVGGDNFFEHDKDKKIQAAVKWLKQQQ